MMATVSVTFLGSRAMNKEHGPADPPPDSLTSLELVLRHHAGDEGALEVLFERYNGRLQRWAHGRLSNSARGALQTHDLVQETLLQVFKNIEQFQPRHEGAFQGYVLTTLRSRVFDALRRYQRRGPTESLDEGIAADEASPYEIAVGRETLARYDAALSRLRTEDRDLIIARIELGRPYAEMVEQFEKPSVAAVTMAVKRALVRLAEEMAHERKR